MVFHMPPTYANGHISATGDPIHFMFGSMVGFSGTADRTALFTFIPGLWAGDRKSSATNSRQSAGRHYQPTGADRNNFVGIASGRLGVILAVVNRLLNKMYKISAVM